MSNPLLETGEMILPEELDGAQMGVVLREVRLKAEVTRYQVEVATGQHYIKKIEQGVYSTTQLRTLLKWCECCDFEVVLRPKTRADRVDPEKLK